LPLSHLRTVGLVFGQNRGYRDVVGGKLIPSAFVGSGGEREETVGRKEWRGFLDLNGPTFHLPTLGSHPTAWRLISETCPSAQYKCRPMAPPSLVFTNQQESKGQKNRQLFEMKHQKFVIAIVTTLALIVTVRSSPIDQVQPAVFMKMAHVY
jgi:hypothetical protein